MLQFPSFNFLYKSIFVNYKKNLVNYLQFYDSLIYYAYGIFELCILLKTFYLHVIILSSYLFLLRGNKTPVCLRYSSEVQVGCCKFCLL